MPIGIFNGKKALNNHAILRALIEKGQPMAAWAIAGAIGTKAKRRHNHSLLIRKNGRLFELTAKGYIEMKEKRYIPTFKGVIAVLVKDKQLPKVPVALLSIELPKETEVPFFGGILNGSKLQQGFDDYKTNLADKDLLGNLRKIACELLDSGIELDNIPLQSFFLLMITKVGAGLDFSKVL